MRASQVNKMPLFGKKDPEKKAKKEAAKEIVEKQPSVEDKYYLKELLGT